MTNRKRATTALIAGGLCAFSLAVAPIASAAQTGAGQNCASVGANTTLCQSNGSASLSTQPTVRAYQWYPWYGMGMYGHRR